MKNIAMMGGTRFMTKRDWGKKKFWVMTSKQYCLKHL